MPEQVAGQSHREGLIRTVSDWHTLYHKTLYLTTCRAYNEIAARIINRTLSIKYQALEALPSTKVVAAID